MAHTGPPKGPLQIAWVNTRNLLMQRKETGKAETETGNYQGNWASQGRVMSGGSVAHFPPGTVKHAITAHMYGKRQQQKALSRLQ